MDKKKSIILIITVFLLGILTTAGSFAYWSWQSDTNKNIVFNTAKELQEYIEYDEGESTFVGNFQIGNTYLDGIHSTIAINKTQEAANVRLLATINMDINAIGLNMAKSSALLELVLEM